MEKIKFIPTLESTSFQTKDDVYRNADALLQCAKFSLEKSGLQKSSFINASLVNSCLSLELYLKSVFLERVFQDYTYSENDIKDMARCADVDISIDPDIEITQHHTNYVSNVKTHELFELINRLPELFRNSIYSAILKQGCFTCLQDIDCFFNRISNNFVAKRYAYEQYFLSDLGDYNDAKKIIDLIALTAPIIVKLNQDNEA